MRILSTTSRLRIVRWCAAAAMAMVLAGIAWTTSGCAVLAGGAAGAATGYVAGKAAK